MKQIFVVVKDRFGSVYADSLDEMKCFLPIKTEAEAICKRNGIDDAFVEYGIVGATDAGMARLMLDKMRWVGNFDASNLG